MAAEPNLGVGDGELVLISRAAQDAIKDLSRRHRSAVAQAADRIARGEQGQPLRLTLPEAPEQTYYAMASADKDAPVVIYRHFTEEERGDGDGYLIANLVSPSDYKSYEHAEERGILDRPSVRYLLDIAGVTAHPRRP
jgi:hypothetical protein